MKILSIVPYKYLPYHSGGQKLIAAFYTSLSEKIQLHVVCTSDTIDDESNKYTLYPILGKGLVRYINPFNYFKIKKIIRREKVNTIILEHPYLGWIGIILKIFVKIVLVVHTHNIEFERFKSIGKWWWKILMWYEKFIICNADLVMCISEDDQNGFITCFNLDRNKTIVVPYGIQVNREQVNKTEAKLIFCEKYNINPEKYLLTFAGSYDYKPNIEALDIILNEINPRLINILNNYHIVIAGNKLPSSYKNLIDYPNITYLGYIEDINLFNLAGDLFLNPVTTGGGIKTKIIDALGMNATVISSDSGAKGINKIVTGNKLICVEDENWELFAKTIAMNLGKKIPDLPESFYKMYEIKNITQMVYHKLGSIEEQCMRQ